MQQVAVMTIKSNGQSKDTVVNTLIKQRHQLLSVIFLLTGDADATVEAATEAVDASHAATPFFDLWMTAWARRLVIARALQAVKQQMATSIARHAKPSGEDLAKPCSLPSPRWSVAQEVTGVHLQRALLAIDIFPRCALILSVFEGMPVDDVASLLGTDKKRVKSAEVTALTELTRNIALQQGWSPMEAATAPSQ